MGPILGVCVVVFAGISQAYTITDDFEDGDYTANPTWTNSVSYMARVDSVTKDLRLYGTWDSSARAVLSLNFGSVPVDGSVSVTFDAYQLKNFDSQAVLCAELAKEGGAANLVKLTTNPDFFGWGTAATGIALFDINNNPVLSGPDSTFSVASQTISLFYSRVTGAFQVSQNGSVILTATVPDLAVDTLKFWNESANDDMSIDNVSVTVVPEPVSFLMMSLCGLAILRRRR